ncbi:hypothetical protein, partial [Streptomyces mirabilis]|uniref:hypothetical protein n=1 Tax=Streptomyces mirabilis TaxID=68239 RepID=UPI0036A284E7
MQAKVQKERLPGACEFRGNRASDWAPKDPDKFKLPQQGSDDVVVALVIVWSEWAGENVEEKWWRAQLERARREQAEERLAQVGSGDRGPRPQTVTIMGAVELEVHPAVLPDRVSDQSLPELTPYLSRPHDNELRKALAPALAGGPSILVILTGDSSTGKTRALYEALCDLAPYRPLLRPRNAVELLELLRSESAVPKTVLWLNEAQRFLNGHDGERVAAELLTLLHNQPGIAALGTLWYDPYWTELTQPGVPGDPHSHARALLMGPVTRRIPVAAVSSEEDQRRWRELNRQQQDPRLEGALNAGAVDGKVVQHLSGGPELLAAFLEGPGVHFTSVEHALLTAALDARRLGHAPPLPAALLADAADGVLTDRQRMGDVDWAKEALDALSTGHRSNGCRTDIRHALTALTALRVKSGTPAHYEPADYLDQHTRQRRADQLGAPSLWQAMLEHITDPDALYRVAGAADRRGLHKQAARLLRKATLTGHSEAPNALLRRLNASGLDPFLHAANWIVRHANVTDPRSVGRLLRELRNGEVHEAVAVLGQRAITETHLPNPGAVGQLLLEMREAGALGAAEALAHRAATDTHLTSRGYVGQLLRELKKAEAHGAVKFLANYAATKIPLTSPGHVIWLLRELRRMEAYPALAILVHRATTETPLMDAAAGARLLRELREAGAREVLLPLAHRVATETPLRDASAVAQLFFELRRDGVTSSADAQKVVAALAHRATSETQLTDVGAVARLLRELREVGGHEAVAALAHRATTESQLTRAGSVARLLRELREVGGHEAVAALAHRATTETQLTHPESIGRLLGELREAGEHEAVAALAQRTADEASMDLDRVAQLLRGLREVGGHEAVAALAHRVTTGMQLTGAGSVARLVGELRGAGAHEAVAALVHRVTTEMQLTRPGSALWLLGELREAGEHEAVAVLVRRVAAEVQLTDPELVGRLLGELREAGEHEAVAVLVRRVAAEVQLTDPELVGRLLRELREAGDHEAVAVLADRIVTQNPCADSRSIPPLKWSRREREETQDAVLALVRELRQTGEHKTVAFHARRTAVEIPLTDLGFVVCVLRRLRAVEAHKALVVLARRVAAEVQLTEAGSVAELLGELRGAGA